MNPFRACLFAGILAGAASLMATAGAAPFDFPGVPAGTVPPRVVAPAAASAHPGDPLAALDWLEQKVLAPDGQATDLFGFRVLIEGDIAFVSAPAPGPRPGAVHVYTRTGETWTHVQKIVAEPPAGTPPGWSDFFGWSLSYSEGRLLVGAPQVFNPMFGPVGGAFLFTRDGETGEWAQTAAFVPPQPASVAWYGIAVGLTGGIALIGESNFDRNGPVFQGAAHLYNEIEGVWTFRRSVLASDGAPADGRGFGSAIAVSPDGRRVAIGAPGPDWASSGNYPDGAAYAFSVEDGDLVELQRLAVDDSHPGDQFGYSLALDDSHLLVGSPAANVGSNLQQGAAYAFDEVDGAYVQADKLTQPAGEPYDQFGQSVALGGGLAAVGMWRHTSDPGLPPPPPTPGEVHVFTAAGAPWTPLGVLAPSDGAGEDSFGWDVAVGAGTVLVGAQGTVDGNPFQGAAYFYRQDDTVFRDGFDPAPAR